MIPKFDSWFKSWDHIFNEDSPANTSISLVLLGGYHLAMLATQRLSRGHLSYSEAAYTLKNDINYSTELSGLYMEFTFAKFSDFLAFFRLKHFCLD